MKLISKLPEITFDDVLLLPNHSAFPIEKEIQKIDLKTRLTKKIFLDIPIVSAPMPGVTESVMAIAIAKAGGIGFIHHFQSFERQLNEVKNVKEKGFRVAACVSDYSNTGIRHIENLCRINTDIISVETAHANNAQTILFIRQLKKNFRNIQISAALVVDASATEALIKAGADNIRVGIGGGSHCTTRLVTGVGRPQLSAVAECYKITKKYNIPLISDTGVRYAGDLPKAIAFGADTVMIGGLFSGTSECPGNIIEVKGKLYKHSWGMCTDPAMRHKKPWESANGFSMKIILKTFVKNLIGRKSQAGNLEKSFEEGVMGLIPYKGSVQTVISDLVAGTRRSMWYQGATTIGDLRKKARIVLVSPNTLHENLPRI